MAKKYHQSKRDRMDESRGMKKRMGDYSHKKNGNSKYKNSDMMYHKDSGMISEDHYSFANLPQNVMMKEYPRFQYGLDPYLNDTSSGIDNQMYDDMHQMKRHESKSKY